LFTNAISTHVRRKEKKNLVNGVGCKIITQLVHKQCGHYNQTNYGYCNKNNNAKMNIKLKKKVTNK